MAEVLLVIIAGEGMGTKFPLKAGEQVIGRGEAAQIRVNDAKASSRHCKVFLEPDGRVVVTDLKSRNGTFVNGIARPMADLTVGDRLVVGSTVFELRKGIL